MLKIGVLGSQGKTETIEMLKDLFQKSDLKVSVMKSIYDEGFETTRYINTLKENHFDIAIIKLSLRALKLHYFEQVKFDIIIYTTRENSTEDVQEAEIGILQHLNEQDYIIINADEIEILKKIHGKKVNIITYGLNPKASVTLSSIETIELSPTVQCCIQRSLITLAGIEIEPQEFPIMLPVRGMKNVQNALSAVIAAMINDIKIGIF